MDCQPEDAALKALIEFENSVAKVFRKQVPSAATSAISDPRSDEIFDRVYEVRDAVLTEAYEWGSV